MKTTGGIETVRVRTLGRLATLNGFETEPRSTSGTSRHRCGARSLGVGVPGSIALELNIYPTALGKRQSRHYPFISGTGRPAP